MHNGEVQIDGDRLLLVPYLSKHVAAYHRWMTSPELLEKTCSEPLSLEEEQQNQKDWLASSEKLTFILVDKESLRLVGDCNLFLLESEEEEDAAAAEPSRPATAEVEVMIAEPDFRRRGLAAEAVQLLMRYGSERVGVREFVAKILRSNEASLLLFEDKLGFSLFREVEVFEEKHYRLSAAPGNAGWDAALQRPFAVSEYQAREQVV
eukprot:TRINITY_DN9541_c1_g1_i1.p1 TRINITY_DN9541_c1_g1~~TRINITY_DN9541_c1_g1_i1.p1  ORF type:complete len:207 (+),score=87.44 TRINITY_DN9541_c1_g1_i1:119-739(+)